MNGINGINGIYYEVKDFEMNGVCLVLCMLFVFLLLVSLEVVFNVMLG